MGIYTTRKEAKEAGEKRYAGKPCVKCGNTIRYVSTNKCVECKSNLYRKYREENPEKVKAYNKKHRDANREKVKARNKKYRSENPEKVKAYSKKYYEENSEKVKACKLKYYYENLEVMKARNKKYRSENPERVKERNKNWRLNNPEKTRTHVAKRKAAKLQRTPPWVDYDAIRVFYAEAIRLTNETGIKHHVDHIIPLQGKLVSGFHVHTNLQVITAEENLRKLNSFSIA